MKTLDEFNRLPLLVRLRTVVEWTGLDRRKVIELVHQRVIRKCVLPGHGVQKGLYYREDLRRILFANNNQPQRKG